MSLTQIVYASRPLGFDLSVLDDILTISRRRNSQADITGIDLPKRYVSATDRRSRRSGSGNLCAD